MEKNNNFFKSATVAFITFIITALVTCSVTIFAINEFCLVKIGNKPARNGFGKILTGMMTNMSKDSENIPLNNKVAEIQNKLDELYIGEIDEEKMLEGALEGYVAAVGDDYTEYLDKQEIADLKEDVNGSYVGVGLYIAQNAKTNEIFVVGVIDDSPAEKAGVLVGDVIKKIDDSEYNGEQLTQASKKMKGIPGTQVKLTIQRDDEQMNLDVVRNEIKFKSVKSEKLDNDIGYIKISSFGGTTAKDFKNEYKGLSEQKIKSLIIDLRQNGGGLVDQALDIAEMIVPKGATMLITQDKDKQEEVSKSNNEPSINIPIVILVDEYTASASEILTAAIRENTNTKIIGTKTYGKGVIQGVYLLEDQVTGLKVTIQEYFTPNHNKIHKIGITPDEIVELPEEWKGHTVVERQYDTQLNRAIEILK